MQVEPRIEVIQADITTLAVDAIVNAANSSLLGGGGVDGAIHRVAGPELLEECRKLGGCPTGQARITNGYRLPARWVIHTVGPVWRGGTHNEDSLLAACYRNCLLLTVPYGIQAIAFPSISTGAYGFPLDRAARIAVEVVQRHLANYENPQRVIFVCFQRTAFDLYQSLVTKAQP
ncbi:MAG TPA: O-acetyl-ADP-ribose deacetylase [Chloroflexota bacterium]|jgi:O-acetyl-ADP-ribose deacetylase (regulator of RNase III)|nr:O-acetyl-ADP-ribose deacetylase [Chloroflexota bacterium]